MDRIKAANEQDDSKYLNSIINSQRKKQNSLADTVFFRSFKFICVHFDLLFFYFFQFLL